MLKVPFVPMGCSVQCTYYLNSSKFFFPNFPETRNNLLPFLVNNTETDLKKKKKNTGKNTKDMAIQKW